MLEQGYNRCSTLVGKENDLQARIKVKYTKIVHYALHKITFVIHDLNNMSIIRICVGMLKTIITFFEEKYYSKATGYQNSIASTTKNHCSDTAIYRHGYS